MTWYKPSTWEKSDEVKINETISILADEGSLTETPYVPVGMNKVLEITMHSGDIEREPETCGEYRK